MVKTKEQLVDFESRIAGFFNAAMIKAPVHLSSGNEDFIMDIFKEVDIEKDWVCCTWRGHLQALLKGIPEDVLERMLLDGKSMSLNSIPHKFISSAIVGGIAPIATGIALANKLRNKSGKVWCWIGDMSAETGAFHEAYKYARNHELPVIFVVEDNGKSVCTPTRKIWGNEQPSFLTQRYSGGILKQPHLYYYQYENIKYPHAGAGVRVQF